MTDMIEKKQNPDLIVLHPEDNVATALKNLSAGTIARITGPAGWLDDLMLSDEIRLGHKTALRPIAGGALVIKHGVSFGRATAAIEPGEHVHVHNVLSLSRETDLLPGGVNHG